MDNQHRKIKGYRELDQAEVDLMNEIKEEGIRLDNLIKKVQHFNVAAAMQDSNMSSIVDESEAHRWGSIARTDLQTGLMALTRAVAKPAFF